MKNYFYRLATILMLLAMSLSVNLAQGTTGAIAGTIVDSTGAVVPNATVIVKGESGQEFTVTTAANGTYNIPAVAAGVYTVTVTATNFKTTVVENVKVDVGVPRTVDAALETGSIQESVVITSGGEVLQTQTATVSSTILGRQIVETPITSRDALDLVTLLPGTSTTGAARRSTVNGLPKGALGITIDGVEVQDNYLRSSDGFFTFIRPRIDALEEVTVSTANPGAESSGDSAVQIKFITRRGTNDYNGSAFWQHRNDYLNANYWYNNRDGLPRQVMRLNQYGARFGGPIPFLNFGEGVPAFSSGRDKRFFFVNYEEFRYPETSPTRNRQILTTQAQSGIYRYLVGGQLREVNLYNLAAANNLPNTPDPTIGAILSDIRAATATTGVVNNVTNAAGAITDYNRQVYSFTNPGSQVRKFLALRFDFNLTKNHSLENVTNYQKFSSFPDMANGTDSPFPGFPNVSGQYSTRPSNSTALRSTLRSNLINEARFNWLGGESQFTPEVSTEQFANQGGFLLNLASATFGGTALTNAASRNQWELRASPSREITDSLTWIKGSHTLNFGGQYKRVEYHTTTTNFVVPTVYFTSINSVGDKAAFDMFTLASCTVTGNNPIPNGCLFPNATATQLDEARRLYAVLTGRITQVDFWAYQTPDGVYSTSTLSGSDVRQETYGLYAQDAWRARPNLTINYGLRWQPQTSYIALSKNFGRLAEFDDIYGLSGPGNIFKPGTLTGRVPIIEQVQPGEAASPTDYNNFAPSVGVVWSPDFGDKGLLRSIFGASGRSVFRGGYSQAFIREGSILLINLLGGNPGGSRIDLRRHSSFLNITPGTLLRDPNNPNLVPQDFAATPTFPYTVTQNNAINALDPDLKTGKVHSWSVGYQRELDQNTVVELRYVGNRGTGIWVQHNINEINTIENGFADEFLKAQQNFYLNEAAFAAGDTSRRACTGFVNAAGGCQVSSTNATALARVPTFQYFGGTTGTNQLPILLSYLNSTATNTPNVPGVYTNGFFTNSTNISYLSKNNPNVLDLARTIENQAGARAQGLANGRPANFFYANPTVGNAGAFILRNAEKSWYDAGIIEVRRRLSAGLRVNASYTFAKSFTNAYASSTANDQVSFVGITQRNLELTKAPSQFDIRHAFKFDATLDLPFGSGQRFLSGSNRFVDALVGGWTIAPVIRWQSGSPFAFQNVQLVGMTKEELQREIKVRRGDKANTYLPDDIILNTQRAFDININNANGYGTTYGGAPEGRFIAPAGYGNCVSRYSGECGYANLVLYGPSFFKFDASVIKRFKIDEKRNIELRANIFDVLNSPPFRVGAWTADTVVITGGGATFGQLGATSAYQDVGTTNDPGGRIIEMMLRINF